MDGTSESSSSSQDEAEKMDEETKGGQSLKQCRQRSDSKKEIVLYKMETDIVKMTAKRSIYYYALKLPTKWSFLKQRVQTLSS